jgi:hypothetical protein
MRALIVAVVSMAAASCTTTSNYTPTMASDPPVIGNEASVLRNEMLLAFEKIPEDQSAQSALCRVIPESYQNRDRYVVKELRSSNRSLECYRFTNVRPGEEGRAQLRSYILSGMSLTDYYCSVFFDRIATHSSKRRFARGGVNDVGAAITALLGFASAGSAVTGATGAGFGLFDSTFRNYDEAFLVHEDLPALQKLVVAEQGKFKTSLFTASNDDKFPTTFQEASSVINDYAKTCTFTGMRGLLNESMIEKAQKSANPLDQSRVFNPAELSLENWKKIQNFLKESRSEGTEGDDANGSATE